MSEDNNPLLKELLKHFFTILNLVNSLKDYTAYDMDAVGGPMLFVKDKHGYFECRGDIYAITRHCIGELVKQTDYQGAGDQIWEENNKQLFKLFRILKLLNEIKNKNHRLGEIKKLVNDLIGNTVIEGNPPIEISRIAAEIISNNEGIEHRLASYIEEDDERERKREMLLWQE